MRDLMSYIAALCVLMGEFSVAQEINTPSEEPGVEVHSVFPWKAGDSWKLRVIRYKNSWAIFDRNEWPKLVEEQKKQIAGRYVLLITVQGEERFNGADYWMLNYKMITDPGPLIQKDQEITLWIGKNDGHLYCKRRSQIFPYTYYFGYSKMSHVPISFPVELALPDDKYLRTPSDATSNTDVAISRTEYYRENVYSVEISFDRMSSSSTVSHTKVVQTWPPNAKWWTSYTRYEELFIDLEAYLIEDSEDSREESEE